MVTDSGVTLTKQQENAVITMQSWYNAPNSKQIFVLSGYAGTGKTFLISYFAKNILNLDLNNDIIFCAPTGKAAVILMRKGLPAKTLHKVIYDPIEIEDKEVIGDETVIVKKVIFRKKDHLANNPKLIILDEVSMVNDKMLNDLLSFNVKVICLGDSAQLPPVSGTNTLINRPDFTLSEILRQKENDPIIMLATQVRNCEKIQYGNFGSVIIHSRKILTEDQRRYLLTQADQVLCGLNRTRTSLNKEIRNYLGYHDDGTIYDGEKVICTANSWEKIVGMDDSYDIEFSLVNGMMGFCNNYIKGHDGIDTVSFRPDFLTKYNTTCYIDSSYFFTEDAIFDRGNHINILPNGNFLVKKYINRKDYTSKAAYKNAVKKYNRKLKMTVYEEPVAFILPGYALSVHKSQGSEYDSVLLFDESYCFGDDSYKWLYTGITRAKKKLVIIR